jgi:hypothetical protein
MLLTKRLGEDVAIFNVNNHKFDVFYGNSGWNNHARFSLKKQFLVQESGERVPRNVLNIIHQRLKG